MSYIAKIKNLDNREVAFEENDSCFILTLLLPQN